MYRDDRDALRQQYDSLTREADNLRGQNAAMRDELLARRRGLQVTAQEIYASPVEALSEGERVALSYHSVTPFPVWATGVLHVLTFGLFPLIHFGLVHDQLPQATENDPTAGKAIGFTFIPYFNLYWIFFNSIRIADRLNLQLRLRGLEPEAPRGLMIACSVLTVIPYVNFFVGIPILWLIGNCMLQQAVNRVAALPPLAPAAEGAEPGRDPYALPPADLVSR